MGNHLKTRLFGEGSTNSVGLGTVVDWLLLASEKEKAAIRAIVTDPRSGLGAGSPPAPDQADLDLDTTTAARITANEQAILGIREKMYLIAADVETACRVLKRLEVCPPKKAKAKNGSSQITQASVELANLA